MSTSPQTINTILRTLQSPQFSARAMFGEYALYFDGRVVGLVCDDNLYVKINPGSAVLESARDKDAPYPGAKPHYLISEDMLNKLPNLAQILRQTAEYVVVKVKKKK